MAQSYISVMDKIKRAHSMYNAIPCMQFDYSLNKYLGYWYAEERLYVIHDSTVNAYYFEIAGNPKDAVERVLRRNVLQKIQLAHIREVENTCDDWEEAE